MNGSWNFASNGLSGIGKNIKTCSPVLNCLDLTFRLYQFFYLCWCSFAFLFAISIASARRSRKVSMYSTTFLLFVGTSASFDVHASRIKVSISLGFLPNNNSNELNSRVSTGTSLYAYNIHGKTVSHSYKFLSTTERIISLRTRWKRSNGLACGW